MLSDSERRELLGQVVTDFVPEDVQIDCMNSEGWSAQVKLEGSTGLVGYLLTSAEWQEARFAKHHRSTLMIADSSDPNDVRRALARLVRAVTAYVAPARSSASAAFLAAAPPS